MPRSPESFTRLQINGGSVTLALRSVADKFEIGVSFCSPNDKPNRVKGNKIALGRLNAKKGFYYSGRVDHAKDPKHQAELNFLALIEVFDRYQDVGSLGWTVRPVDFVNDYFPRWLRA